MAEMLMQGFAAVMNVPCMLLVFAGVAIGIIFGAIPGMSATMAIAFSHASLAMSAMPLVTS